MVRRFCSMSAFTRRTCSTVRPVASATCYTQDLTVPQGGTRGRDGAQAYNLVHVYDDTIVHSVVPVDVSEALDFVDAEETQRRLGLGEGGRLLRRIAEFGQHLPGGHAVTLGHVQPGQARHRHAAGLVQLADARGRLDPA